MTNVERIEKFLKQIIINHGKDPSSEGPISEKLENLLAVIHSISFRLGDDKMNEFFRNILTALVTDTPEGKAKDTYILVLNQFNKELNSLLN